MRKTAVALLVAASVLAPNAFAAEPNSKEARALLKVAEEASRSPLLPIGLSALFATVAEKITVDATGMTLVEGVSYETVIVRRNADGSKSRVCVDNEKAATNFIQRDRQDANVSREQ